MPAARAASAREAPSSTSAKASIRRAARASRHRPASRRRPPASSSRRVIATVIAPPPIGHTADQRPRAARGATDPTVRSRGRWYKYRCAELKPVVTQAASKIPSTATVLRRSQPSSARAVARDLTEPLFLHETARCRAGQARATTRDRNNPVGRRSREKPWAALGRGLTTYKRQGAWHRRQLSPRRPAGTPA